MSEALGSVSVDVKANLDQLSPGFAQAKAQTDAFSKTAAQSMDKVSGAVDDLTATQKKLVQQLVATKATAAEAAAVFGKTAESQKMLAAFTAATTTASKGLEQQLGKTAAAQKNVTGAVAASAKTYENFFSGDFVSQWAQQAQAVGKTTQAYTVNRMQVMELAHSARAMFDGLAAGANPIRLVAMESGRLAQVAGAGPGGLAGALTAIRGLFTPAVIGFGAIAAGALLAAKAVHDYNTELANFGKLTKGVGAGAGVTAVQLQNGATTGASKSGTSVGEARDLETALLKTGQVSGQVFAGILADEKKFAVGTGQTVKDAQADLTRMFVDPGKGADELEQKFGKLTATEIENIKTLQAQGDITGAQIALQKALDKSVGDLDGHLGGLKGTWDSIKSGASQAGSAMAKALTIANALAMGVDLSQINKALDKQAADAKAAATAVANSKASAAGTSLAQSLDPDFAARQALTNQAGLLQRGVMGAGAQGDTAAYDAQTAALAKVNRARETYLSDADKDHQIAQLDAQANTVRAEKETAATRAKLGAIAAQKTQIELSGKVMSASEVQQRASDAAAVASAKESKGSHSHAEALAREAAAMIENAKGSLALADGYLKSDAAALKAEATRKASIDGTKKGIELQAQIRRQLDVDIADKIASGAKEVSTLTATTRAQEMANDAVRAGTATVAQAHQTMEANLQLRDLTTAAEAAHAVVVQQGNKATAEEIAADAAATKVLGAKKDAIDAANKSASDAARLAEMETTSRRNDELALEIKLLGQRNVERDRQLAIQKATQKLDDDRVTDPAKRSAFIQSAVSGANATNALDAAKFIQGQTDAVKQQTDAMKLNAAVFGMTTKDAEAYRFEQQALSDASLRGITLTDQQKTALHALAESYGQASTAAEELARQQKGAADAASYLADQFSSTISDILDGTAKGSDAVKSLAKDLERTFLQSALTGKGAFAGILGTDKTAGPGQPNGGLLSGLFGRALGVGKGVQPTGTATDPLFVMAVGSGSSPASALGGMFGGTPANDNLGASTFDAGADQFSNLGSADFSKGFSLMGDAGGATFIDKLGDVFKQQSGGGGFVGALKDIFGGIGGGGGLTGGLGGLLSKAFGGGGIGSFVENNQSGIGGILGSVLATVAHDGMSMGAQGTGRTRAVDSRLFLSAPRLHDGLAPGEFPAILEQGEGVISKRGAANMNRAPTHVTVNVSGVSDLAGFRRNDRQIGRKIKQKYGIG